MLLFLQQEQQEIDTSWRQNKVIQKIIKEEPIIEKIIMAESSGNAATPDSPDGARGLMQIMKNTAELDTGFGVNYNLSYEELLIQKKM
jgi:membrane-bound lytic murein transglycosylase MltF